MTGIEEDLEFHKMEFEGFPLNEHLPDPIRTPRAEDSCWLQKEPLLPTPSVLPNEQNQQGFALATKQNSSNSLASTRKATNLPAAGYISQKNSSYSLNVGKENEATQALEVKKARDRISQAKYAERRKEYCKIAKQETPKLSKASEDIHRINQNNFKKLNDDDKAVVQTFANNYRKEELEEQKKFIQSLEEDIPTIRTRGKEQNKNKNSINSKVFRAKQSLETAKLQYAQIRLDKQKAIKQEIEKHLKNICC